MNELLNDVIVNVVRLVISGCVAYLSIGIVPWLKEVGAYNVVKMCVRAAEKMASSGQIDKATKKQWVLEALQAMNVKIAPAIETMIEAAVEELDNQKGAVSNAFKE